MLMGIGGNTMRKKKIKCITTNEVFCSLLKASEYYNLNKANIRKSCKDNKYSCGRLKDGRKLYWQYTEEEINTLDYPNKIKETELYNKETFKLYQVYCIKNLITNKIIYIGSTTQRLRQRFQAHSCHKKNKLLYEEIKSYGKENFSIELLYNAINKEEMLKKEEELTLLYSKDYKLYNVKIGNKMSEEMKQNLSEYIKQNPIKNSTHKHFLHKKHTEKTKRKMSEKRKIPIKVICLTTGEIFDSVSDVDGRSDKILQCCRKEKESYRGNKWMFFEEYDNDYQQTNNN